MTEGNTVDKADVTWDTASGNYDPSVLTEQGCNFKRYGNMSGKYRCKWSSTYYQYHHYSQCCGIVGAPTPSVESGTYTENQKVALASSTEGATIYYTTNGSEPGRTGGTRYTGPITVPGTEGQSITTTLKSHCGKEWYAGQ